MFSPEKIQRIWEKATIVSGYDPSKWRQDFAGAWIKRDLFGTTQNYGWEVDHMIPRAQGGSDDIGNLYPLHWQNNKAKADHAPVFTTVLSSEGNKNIAKRKSWHIQ